MSRQFIIKFIKPYAGFFLSLLCMHLWADETITGRAPNRYIAVDSIDLQNSLSSLQDLAANHSISSSDTIIQNAAITHPVLVNSSNSSSPSNTPQITPKAPHRVAPAPQPVPAQPSNCSTINMTFSCANENISIAIQNGSSNPDYQFSTADVEYISNYLSRLPPSMIQGLNFIKAMPSYQNGDTGTLVNNDSGIILNVVPLADRSGIGDNIDPPLRVALATRLWDRLSAQDQTDFATLIGIGDPLETFYNLFAIFTTDTQTVLTRGVINSQPPYSFSANGGSIGPIIDMASFFLSSDKTSMNNYSLASEDGVQQSQLSTVPFALTANQLTLGQFVFNVQNGAIVSVQISSGQSYLMQSPIQIPNSVWARFGQS